VVFYRLTFGYGEPIKDVIIQRFICQVPQGKIRSAFLPSDFGLGDNPLPIDASHFFKRVFLGGEDARTRSTSDQMI